MSVPYPQRIANSTGYAVINRGIGGQRAAQGLARIDTELNQYQPGCVLILFGANDIWSPSQDLSSSANSVIQIAQRVRAFGAIPVIGTATPFIKPRDFNKPRVQTFNNLLRSLASANGISLVDLEKAFGSGYGLILSDGVHPNQTGSDIIARSFAARIAFPPITVKPSVLAVPGTGTHQQSVQISASGPRTANVSASWLTITEGASGSGNGTLRFQASPNNGMARIGTITVTSGGSTSSVTIHQEPEGCGVGSAVNAPVLPWHSGGQAEWFCQSVATYDGALSAQSGTVDFQQQSWVETVVTGQGVLNFWWRIDASGTGSGLEFSTDETTLNLTGASGWQRVSVLLADGLHDLRWTFSRGSQSASTMEAAWLDSVQWQLDGPEGTVYRFWSPVYRSHFFTRSLAERNFIISNWPDVWWFEGLAWYSFISQVPGSLPVFRFWSSTRGTHFYTIDQAERDFIIANWANVWRYEGTSWYAFPFQEIDTIPVYRFWSPVSKAHFYTRSTGERDYIITTWPNQWTYEGVAFYVRETSDQAHNALATQHHPVSKPIQQFTLNSIDAPERFNANPKRTIKTPFPAKTVHTHNSHVISDVQASGSETYSIRLPLVSDSAERAAMLYDTSRKQLRAIIHVDSNSSALNVTGLIEGVSYWLALLSRNSVNHSWYMSQGSQLGRFSEKPLLSNRPEVLWAASNETPVEQITMPMFQGRMFLVVRDDNGFIVGRYDDLDVDSAISLPVPAWNRWYHIAIYDQANGARLSSKWLGHIRTH